jgi:hypothetical protein
VRGSTGTRFLDFARNDKKVKGKRQKGEGRKIKKVKGNDKKVKGER